MMRGLLIKMFDNTRDVYMRKVKKIMVLITTYACIFFIQNLQRKGKNIHNKLTNNKPHCCFYAYYKFGPFEVLIFTFKKKDRKINYYYYHCQSFVVVVGGDVVSLLLLVLL